MNLSEAVSDLAEHASVVVGCSGGADSLALLALACDHGFDVCAVYVDHGLRPGTAHDAEIVKRAAARFGARSRVEHVDLAQGPNLESRAREARYAALQRVRDVPADQCRGGDEHCSKVRHGESLLWRI